MQYDKFMSSRVAILMATYNRVGTTLTCLESIRLQRDNPFVSKVFLVDGGSTDFTVSKVIDRYPCVDSYVIAGAHWNSAMRFAWMSAQKENFDFYLWLNDDVALNDSALRTLFDTHHESGGQSIVVGKTSDPFTQDISYGLLARAHWKSRLNFELVKNDQISGVTMNGNIVLVDRDTVNKIGILSDIFTHSMGDIEYGLRASKAGIRLISTKLSLGNCPRNPSWNRAISTMSAKNLRFIFKDPKGIPPREWLYMCRHYGGPLWPINFVWRYLKIVRL